ncbi:MAG: PEP-CTERM sorting domain-containing protein [Burkholderiales bacterium]|nr:PEP-CTERM sorting domain-containing protein [Burkholderiales bacterium]
MSIDSATAGPISVAFDYFNVGTYVPSFMGFLTYFNTSTSLVLTLVSENRVELLPVTTSFISNRPEMSPWPENFTASTFLTVVTSPVPEPETYAMMLSGLGLLSFMARRKNQKTA